MVRNLGGLRPIDKAGEQMLSKLDQGRLVKVVVTQPRNINHHRLFFALLNAVFRNLPEDVDIPSVDALLGMIKITVGHYDICVSNSGVEFRIPKSISFAKMDQTEFDRFFSACCDVIKQYFIPGVTEEQWRAEIAKMMGADRAAAGPEQEGREA